MHSTLEKTEDECKVEWTCEFCDTVNQLDEKDLFQPDEEDIEIVVEAGKVKPKQKVDETKTAEQTKKESDEISVVFCVDISGSMGTHSQGLSRLDCVKQAMIKQIDHMSETNENRKIGLVTFEARVRMIGDGKKS
jgi:Mg-chelatase subunit ChlD